MNGDDAYDLQLFSQLIRYDRPDLSQEGILDIVSISFHNQAGGIVIFRIPAIASFLFLNHVIDLRFVGHVLGMFVDCCSPLRTSISRGQLRYVGLFNSEPDCFRGRQLIDNPVVRLRVG